MKHHPAKRTQDPCPPTATLVEFSLGTLSRSDVQSVSDHLAGCESCLGVMQTLDDRADDLVLGLRLQRWEVPARPDPADEAIVERLTQFVSAPSTFHAATEAIVTDHNPPDQIGPYQILEQIGEGGMGKVYRARHVHMDRIVALKVLVPERMGDPTAVARFEREMRAVGQVSHPNVVQAFDAGVADVPYLAMELIEGSDLGRLVKQRGPLPVPEACECVRQAAMGLEHAHQRGLVHRDLKPSNLMLTPQGVVKILDLGLARVAPESPQPPRDGAEGILVTRDDAFLGTPGYVAPEQLKGAHAVDVRADLYGLGCTLFCLLSGRSPPARTVTADEPASLVCLTALAPDVREARPEVPRPLASIIDQLLANDPNFRPDSAASLARLLLPFVTGANPAGLLGATARPVDPLDWQVPLLTHNPQQTQPAAQSQGTSPWLLGVATFLLALALLALLFTKWGSPRQPRTPPPAAQTSLIDTLQVEQFRATQGRLTSLGELGADRLLAEQTDLFRVRAQLTAPAYCYLVAFGPDADGVLCFPGEADEAPGKTQGVFYPVEDHARLSKPGLYAFALVASRTPLPPYAAWRDRLPKFHPDASREGVWRFDGQKVVTLRGGPMELDQPSIPAAVQELSNALSSDPAYEARILAFSVR